MRLGISLTTLFLFLYCSVCPTFAEPTAPSLLTHDIEDFSSVIRSIIRYDGRIWFGTYGRGVFSLKSDGSLINYRSDNSPLLDNRVNTLSVFKGELWLGTCAGLNRFDGKTWKKVTAGPSSVSGNIYHCARVSADGDSIWIGTTGNGLSVYRDEKWLCYDKGDGLNSNWINDVAFVKGSIWVATSNGICRRYKDQGRWKSETPRDFPLNNNTVWIAHVPSREELWIASAERGVWYRQDGYWNHPPDSLLASPKVFCLEADQEGNLWIGTKRGISRYHLATGWVSFKKENGLLDPYTKVLYWDAEARSLWAGSFGGVLSRYDGKEWKAIVKDNDYIR